MSGTPPPTIRFEPERSLERLRFLVRGRRMFEQAMHALAAAPPDLPAPLRQQLQRDWAERLLRHLRARLEIRGHEHLPCAPHLIVALHEGMADVLCLMRLGLPMRIVARAEIFGWPLIGPAIERMKHISIDPEAGARSYRQLRRSLQDATAAGEHVAMFPQGTVLGIETDFRAGAFRLARALRLPLLPIVISGTHRIWEHPFSPRLRYGQHVAMHVLEPIDVGVVVSTSPEVLRHRLQRRMKQLALSSGAPAPRRYQPARDGFWDGFSFGIDPDFPAPYREVERHRSAASARN